ncbi:MAG: response regulator [Lentisphaerae bacterium]|nr:response regulator [Lentisphaerota bacterium]
MPYSERNKFAQTVRIAISADQIEEVTAQPKVGRIPKAVKVAAFSLKDKLGPSGYSVYRQLIDSIYDAVLVTDFSGKILDTNVRAEDFFHYPSDAMSAMSILDVIGGLTESVIVTIRENLMNERFTLLEAFCLREDTSMFPAEIVTSKITLAGVEYLCLFIRDITRRKENEEELSKARDQLARAERLETAGSIAGHIAHDFNNLLTPLLAYPELIKGTLPEDSPAREDLTLIERTAQQIADINQQLLALSRRGHFEQTVINLNDIVLNVMTLMERSELAKGIRIHLNCSKSLPNIKGSNEQLLRVIQNLCQNAMESMENDGDLVIETLVEPLDNVQIPPSYKLENDTDFVRLSISDTGRGIPHDILDKIFDPFFTTKKATKQRGSGLGLSVVHSIVKDHDGFIDIDTYENNGTTFSLYFQPSEESLEIVDKKIFHANGEKVLIIDDDKLQLEVNSRILNKLGYSVVTAQSGEEAVEVIKKCAQNGEFPDLLLLDMIMGEGINGTETFRRIKTYNPNQKAVILSGYAESVNVIDAQRLGAGPYIRKPVSIERMSMVLHKELNK